MIYRQTILKVAEVRCGLLVSTSMLTTCWPSSSRTMRSTLSNSKICWLDIPTQIIEILFYIINRIIQVKVGLEPDLCATWSSGDKTCQATFMDKVDKGTANQDGYPFDISHRYLIGCLVIHTESEEVCDDFFN